MKEQTIKIERLVLSIATNQFTVPLPSGKDVVEAVNNYDALRARCNALEVALKNLCGFLNVTPLRLNDGDSMTISMLTDAAREALAEGGGK